VGSLGTDEKYPHSGVADAFQVRVSTHWRPVMLRQSNETICMLCVSLQSTQPLLFRGREGCGVWSPNQPVAGVCANLLLSYQRNSVGVDGNGGDEGCSGGF